MACNSQLNLPESVIHDLPRVCFQVVEERKRNQGPSFLSYWHRDVYRGVKRVRSIVSSQIMTGVNFNIHETVLRNKLIVHMSGIFSVVFQLLFHLDRDFHIRNSTIIDSFQEWIIWK